MATTATGVEVPSAGDAFDPQGDMVELANSLRSRITVPVANDAERVALPGLIGWTPSAAEPLVVRQADTRVTASFDGTNWRVLGSVALDATFALNTGLWVAESGHTPTLQRRGDMWLFSGRVRNAGAGTFSSGNATLGTLPVEARVAGGGTLTAAAAYRSGATWGTASPISVNLATGAVTAAIPATVTVGAGALDIAWAGITWAARAAVL